jgi:hypothetical protein
MPLQVFFHLQIENLPLPNFVFKVAKSRNLDSAPDPREYPFFLLMSGLKYYWKKDTA